MTPQPPTPPGDGNEWVRFDVFDASDVAEERHRYRARVDGQWLDEVYPKLLAIGASVETIARLRAEFFNLAEVAFDKSITEIRARRAN